MLQAFHRLAVYIPISEADGRPDSDVVSASAVQAILRVFRRFDFAGSVGTYNAVVEISTGVETFVPTQASAPTKGEADVTTNVMSARLVTYIPATTPEEALSRLIDQVVSAHPWEHPVLELDRVSLWIPS